MARTIMIADRVYADLKKAKGADKSFSEVIAEALEKSGNRRKTIADVLKHAGALKGYKEDEEAAKWLKDMWGRWNRRLDREMNKESF
ncbi:antitoxin VapB family protein [Candidatus Woesearchaeota archaeon]|nr:antitoxin VapB family protein [Candidatus Woesearchaeota archaeon]